MSSITKMSPIRKVKIVSGSCLADLEQSINEYLQKGYLEEDTRHVVEDIKIIEAYSGPNEHIPGYGTRVNSRYVALLIGRWLENKDVITT